MNLIGLNSVQIYNLNYYILQLKKIYLLSFFLFFCVSVFSQERIPNKFSFDGLVYGYHNDPGKLLAKNKEIQLEGVLADVLIEIKSVQKSIASKRTGADGHFTFSLDLGKTYTIYYSKKGYAKGNFKLDLRNIPEDIAEKGVVFAGMELILNSFKAKKAVDPSLDFGKLYFDASKEAFAFKATPHDKKDLFVKRNQADTPVDLMKGAVENNRENNKRTTIAQNTPVIQKSKPRKIKSKSQGEELAVEDSTEVLKSVLAERSNFSLKSIIADGDLSMDKIADREKEIKKAWEELEKDKMLAVTPEDMLLIEAREELLMAAEKDLEKAKEIIGLQEDRISTQRTLIIVFIVLAVILLAFLFMIYRNYREKIKVNLIIRKKNKRITSSINYASRIQEAILLPDAEIKQLLPESFVYFEPRDTVSGDFYWVAEIDNKVVFAAIDCTGHGVPGAFMSMIGNTLLNQIVRERKIIQPAEILQNLHEEIMVALRQNPRDPMSNQDGMDMAICCLDRKKNELQYAGAMNPLYLVKGDEIQIINGDKRGIGGGMMSRKMRKQKTFTNHVIQLEKGNCLYLFSDGYMAQFGGEEKQEKFNTERFSELLLRIQSMNMEAQKNEVNQTLRNWQGTADQVDDILLMGVRV